MLHAGMANAQYAVKSGGSIRLRSFFFVGLDCKPEGTAVISRIRDPQYGTLQIARGTGYPTFLPPNPRTQCNTHLLPATIVVYQSRKGLKGTDQVAFDVLGPFGRPVRIAVMVSIY